MLEKLILLIDNRKEQTTKYKKILKSEEIKLIIKKSIKDAINDIVLLQPDIIIFSDSTSNSMEEDIKNLKIISYHSQPVIIGLSKSSDSKLKIKTFEAGADDFFEEPVIKEEFKAKIQAHLRRLTETQTNLHTGLYNSKITYKVLNRTLIYDNYNWSVLLVGINNFQEYKIVYGELAAEKMLKAYIAILDNVLDKNDYLGQLGNDDFIVITDSIKAEKIAEYSIHAFDIIAQKFYTEKDLNQGYIILSSDDTEEKPIPIVSLSIAGVSNTFKKYDSIKELITDLLVLHKSARSRVGSNYLLDRPKISSENTIVTPEYNNKIVIIEEDEALNLLIESNLIMRNCEIKSFSSFDEIKANFIKDYKPALIIIDAGSNKKLNGLDFIKNNISQIKKLNTKTILTTTIHNKEDLLNTGVDLYLPKPYDIKALMYWVEKFLKEFNL